MIHITGLIEYGYNKEEKKRKTMHSKLDILFFDSKTLAVIRKENSFFLDFDNLFAKETLREKIEEYIEKYDRMLHVKNSFSVTFYEVILVNYVLDFTKEVEFLVIQIHFKNNENIKLVYSKPQVKMIKVFDLFDEEKQEIVFPLNKTIQKELKKRKKKYFNY